MSLRTISDVIKAAVESVASVGVVTDFEPYAIRDEDLATFFGSTAPLKGWTITREKTDEELQTTDRNLAHHLMVIRGYHALQAAAASEKTFQDLIEAVRTRLRLEQRDQLKVTGEPQATLVGPPSVRIVEARLFTSILVHYCEITLRCSEYVAIAP